MTDYERNPFSPITKRETIVRAHSPYSEATGPILTEGTVAARVRAFHNCQDHNSYTPSNKGISTRVQLRSYQVTSPTTGGGTKGDDSRSGYGRRKSLSFAPPASRNTSIGWQHHVPLTRSTPQSSVLPGSGAGTRVEKVGNRFVVVGPDTLSQHVVFSSQAVFPLKHAGPDEVVGLSPGSKLAGEYGLAVLDSVNNKEASTEHAKVLKKKNIAGELGVNDNNSSQTEWSNDSPNPDTLDHHRRALGELNSSPPASAPLIPVGRRHSSSDYQSIAATRHSSTSSGSDHSKRHRHYIRTKCHRKCSTAEETVLPGSSSDTEEYASCLDNTPESGTTVQRHFPHNKASAALPATISPCSPRTHIHYYGCRHQHRLPRCGTTPPRTVIGHKNSQLEEICRPRLIRKYEISSLLQGHKHHHDHSHQAILRPHHTPPPRNQHYTPSSHHHLHPHSHPRIQLPNQHPNDEPSSKVPTQPTSPPPPPSVLPSSLPPPIVPPPSSTPPSTRLTRLRPPLRQHSLPTLAPPLLSPPLATASLLQSRHLSTSSATRTKPTPKRSGWWRFMHVDKTDEIYELAQAKLAPTEKPGREAPSRRVGHTLRDCGLEDGVGEDVASASPGAKVHSVEAAGAAGGTIALTPLLPATHRKRRRASDGKRVTVTGSDVNSTAGYTGDSDAGWRNDTKGEREKGGGGGIRGVRVVVRLGGGGDLVVVAKMRGRD